ANYFKQYNLQVSPEQYRRPFNEGAFRFGVEIIDYQTNRPISGIQWANPVWITINEPPVWVMPQNQLSMEPMTPQNVTFQWAPRHTNVSDVEYEFTMTDLLINGSFNGNVQNLFLAQPAYYTTRTRSTTLNYNATFPPLIPGRVYAYRVQAIAKRGREDVGVFRNNGFSEIQHFTYGTRLLPPTQLRASWDQANKQAAFSWRGEPEHKSFLVEYAEKGANNWQSSPSLGVGTGSFALTSLNPSRNYQLRVYGINEKNERAVSTTVDLESNDIAAFVKAEGVKKDNSEYKGVAKTDSAKLKKQDPTCEKPGLAIDAGTSYEPKSADVLTAGNFRFLNAGDKKGVLQWSIPFAEELKLPVKKVNIWAEMDDKAAFNADKQLKEGTIKVTYNAEKLKELKRVSDKIPYEDLMGDGIGKKLDSVSTQLNGYIAKGQALGRSLVTYSELQKNWGAYKKNLDTLNQLYAVKDSLLAQGINNMKKKLDGDKKDDKKPDKKADKKEEKKGAAEVKDKKDDKKKEEKKKEELTREAKEQLKEKIAALELRLKDTKKEREHVNKLKKLVDDTSEAATKELKALDPRKALKEGYLTDYPKKFQEVYDQDPKEVSFKILKEIFNQFYNGSIGGARINFN
ncbi:MAG: fibronectin type III domain-containing protein, partial [Bacteroidetes bacterium]|nr:fibronectin type III domain-containing protein [Bacteroidota bacterium]